VLNASKREIELDAGTGEERRGEYTTEVEEQHGDASPNDESILAKDHMQTT
jgi:hypothetical protein